MKIHTPVLVAVLCWSVLAPGLSVARAQTAAKRGASEPGTFDSVTKMYESIQYRHFKSRFRRGDYKKVKMLGNFAEQRRALKASKSPDTYWITRWSRLARGHRELAIIQAGINRTWLAACHRDFATFQQRWVKVRRSFDADFAFVRASSTTYYQGANRIRAMWDRLTKLAKSKRLWLTRAHWLNKSNMWAELVTLEYELAGRKKRMGMNRYLAPRWAIQFSRTNPTAEHARTVYCHSASTAGTPTLAKLPQAFAYSRGGKPFIRHVFSKAEARMVKKWAASAKPKASQSNVGPMLHITSLGRKAKRGTMIFVGYGGSPFSPIFKISNIRQRRGRSIVTLKWSRPGTQKYDCKTSNRLQRIDSDGTLLYRVDCKSRPTKFIISVVATFNDLPKGIKKGDTMGLYGKLTRYTMRRRATTTRISATVRGVHVRDVKRGRASVMSF